MLAFLKYLDPVLQSLLKKEEARAQVKRLGCDDQDPDILVEVQQDVGIVQQDKTGAPLLRHQAQLDFDTACVELDAIAPKLIDALNRLIEDDVLYLALRCIRGENYGKLQRILTALDHDWMLDTEAVKVVDFRSLALDWSREKTKAETADKYCKEWGSPTTDESIVLDWTDASMRRNRGWRRFVRAYRQTMRIFSQHPELLGEYRLQKGADTTLDILMLVWERAEIRFTKLTIALEKEFWRRVDNWSTWDRASNYDRTMESILPEDPEADLDEDGCPTKETGDIGELRAKFLRELEEARATIDAIRSRFTLPPAQQSGPKTIRIGKETAVWEELKEDSEIDPEAGDEEATGDEEPEEDDSPAPKDGGEGTTSDGAVEPESPQPSDSNAAPEDSIGDALSSLEKDGEKNPIGDFLEFLQKDIDAHPAEDEQTEPGEDPE